MGSHPFYCDECSIYSYEGKHAQGCKAAPTAEGRAEPEMLASLAACREQLDKANAELRRIHDGGDEPACTYEEMRNLYHDALGGRIEADAHYTALHRAASAVVKLYEEDRMRCGGEYEEPMSALSALLTEPAGGSEEKKA